MADLKHHVTELAQMMEEFGLEDAKLKGEDWAISFSRNLPTCGAVMMSSAPAAEAVAVAPKSKPAKSSPSAPKGTPVSSPMMGIYYGAPSPGQPPFVKEGESVSAGQVVGLIEAMKVFNEITAPMAGTVQKIAVESGEIVQPGEPIMFIG